jgi:hypothetical protein
VDTIDGSSALAGINPPQKTYRKLPIVKYILSFCEIEQLTDDIFEVTINDNAIIDEKCAEEAEIFWMELRNEPYRLLLNNKNQFSYSFIGAQKIGEHLLEKKKAVLIDCQLEDDPMSDVINLKKIAGQTDNIKTFKDRGEALKWLEAE